MRMKKKLVLFAIAAAILVGATTPASAESVLCEMEATSFNHWFYKQFYC